MRNELCARNPKTVRHDTETISFLSPKVWDLIAQNINNSSYLPCLSRALENRNSNTHVNYSKYFCNMLVLYNLTAVLPFQFLIYLKFMLPVPVHITYCL